MNIDNNDYRFGRDWDPATAAGKLVMVADWRVEDVTPDEKGEIGVRITAAGENDTILQGLAIE